MACKRSASRVLAATIGLSTLFVFRGARGEGGASSMRLDGLVDTSRNGGVIAVQGDGSARSWVSAEALIWMGTSTSTGLTGDALVFAVHVREPHGLGELRIGRFLFSSGAILPVQIDGMSGMVRLPWGMKVEAVAGSPVVGVGLNTAPLASQGFAWLAGGRISQTVTSRMTVGVSYVERREGEEMAAAQLGADFAAVPVRWLDIAARAAYDIISPGVSDALISAAARVGDFRFEAFASDRSPSRLLPATSLFSVFGDFASQSIGASIHWKAAPRLDLWLTGAGQSVGGVYGGNGTARGVLKLDDRGDGSLGVELRRQDVSTARWTGVRATATKRLLRTLRCSAEAEIVIADDPQGKGIAWPWGLVSLGWRPSSRWEIAGALESASTPVHELELNALARLSLFLGGK